MNKETGGPAFPITDPTYAKGMTLRDYFAAKAMNGFLINCGVVGGPSPSDEDLARYSYDIADAMLKVRNTS